MPDARSERRSPGPAQPRRPRPKLAETEAGEATGFRFHGPRILLLLILSVATYLLFPAAAVPDLPAAEQGMVPTEDLIAEVDFAVPKNEAELRREQQAAEAAATLIFRYDSIAVDSVRARVEYLLDRIDAAFEPGLAEAESAARLQAALAAASLPARPDIAALLRPAANRNMLRAALRATVDQDLAAGVARSTDLETGPATQVRLIRNGSDRLIGRDSLATETQLREASSRHLPARAPAGLAELQRLVLTSMFRPSIRYDRTATDASRRSARQAVQTIKIDYVAGERVLTAHERIDEDDLERLRAYEARLIEVGRLTPGSGRWLRILATIALNTLVLAIFGLLLKLYRPQIYRSPRALLLLGFLVFAVTSAASVISAAGLSTALIPIAFPALVAAMLWDGRMALTFALVIAILLSLQPPLGELSSRVLLVAAGSAAALSVRAVHSRAHGLILGGVVSAAYFVGAVSVGLLLAWDWSTMASHMLYGTANGLAAALIAVGLMPVFEAWTGITTDQTLLELGDLNRPLLKRLSLEASGTYAHSINVANLAEAAARAIGANPLLARVGAYYHDIGKMAEPQYFVENQARGRNPHDALPAQESAAIVRRHVTEGLRLADEAKLPARLKAFISEHHGTQLIGFFFEKARKGVEVEPDDAEYRYPGPRPTGRETAILMLADSVESAAKVLEEPTPEAIRALVDRIVQGKQDRGELDDSPLTLRDLALVKRQFVSVLAGLYHHRLDYPAAVTAPMRADAEDGQG
jgi:hypothetical protein